MKTRRRTPGIAIVIAVAVALTVSCTVDVDHAATPPGAEPPSTVTLAIGSSTPLSSVRLRSTPIADLGEMATDLVARPGSRQLFVTTRTGLVFRIDRVHEGGSVVPVLQRTPVLDLRAETTTDGERGLLGIEFTEDGSQMLLVRTNSTGEVVIESRAVDRSGTTVATQPTRLGTIPHPFSTHNGGGILRLTDGSFLVSLGDMDTGDAPTPAAQDATTVLGGIVHLPAELSAVRTRVWPVPSDLVAKGLRNPWRMSHDPTTSTVWIGDVGDRSVEEIDALRDTSAAPEPTNFGWPWFEGTTNVRPVKSSGPFEPPVFEYRHSKDRCGIVMGEVPRGRSVDLSGALLYGDLCSRRVEAVRPGTASSSTVAELPEPPISFGVDQDGAVYVLGAQGSIVRLDPGKWKVSGRTDLLPSDDTTTTSSVRRDDLCPVFAVMVELRAGTSPDNTQTRQRVLHAIDVLRDALKSSPPSRRDDVRQVLAVFEAIEHVGEVNGWDTTSPEFADLATQVQQARHPYEEFGSALSRLQAEASCP